MNWQVSIWNFKLNSSIASLNIKISQNEDLGVKLKFWVEMKKELNRRILYWNEIASHKDGLDGKMKFWSIVCRPLRTAALRKTHFHESRPSF